MGPDHPECPERLYAINDQLIASGILDHLLHYNAETVTKQQLLSVHAPDYVEWVFNNAPDSGLLQLDSDTAMNKYTLNAALHAAGAVVQAVDLVMSSQVENAFCCVRPPGHHSGYQGLLSNAKSCGFCIFNSIAAGALHALDSHKCERVAIIDLDIHHGKFLIKLNFTFFSFFHGTKMKIKI